MPVSTRTPTVRFARRHDVEPGTRWSLYWDGGRAANGDGVPGSGGGVNYVTPLHGPVELWPSDQGRLGAWMGRAWTGPAWVGEPAIEPVYGCWEGPWLIGQWLAPGGWASYTFPFSLRDGSYTVGIRLSDAVGNVASSGVETTFEVAAVPRPVTTVTVDSYSVGLNELAISFGTSPDLA